MTRFLLMTAFALAFLPMGCAGAPRGEFVFRGHVVREGSRAVLGSVPVIVTYTPPKFSLTIEEVPFQEIARTTTESDGSFSVRSSRHGKAVSLVALGTRQHTQKVAPGSFVAYGESVSLRHPSDSRDNVIVVHRWFSPAAVTSSRSQRPNQ